VLAVVRRSASSAGADAADAGVAAEPFEPREGCAVRLHGIVTLGCALALLGGCHAPDRRALVVVLVPSQDNPFFSRRGRMLLPLAQLSLGIGCGSMRTMTMRIGRTT